MEAANPAPAPRPEPDVSVPLPPLPELEALRAVPSAGLRAALAHALSRALAEPSAAWDAVLDAAFVVVDRSSAAPHVIARRRIAPGDVFIARHALTATKGSLPAALAGAGDAAAAMLREARVLTPGATDADDGFWLLARASGELPSGDSAWHVEPPAVAWMRHASGSAATARPR